MSSQDDLEQLKVIVAYFKGSEAQAREAEPELRRRRDALISRFADLDAEGARRLFVESSRESHQLLMLCGLRDLPRTAEEDERAESLLETLAATGAPHAG